VVSTVKSQDPEKGPPPPDLPTVWIETSPSSKNPEPLDVVTANLQRRSATPPIPVPRLSPPCDAITLMAPLFDDRTTFPESEVTLVVPAPVVISQFPAVTSILHSPEPTARLIAPKSPTFRLINPAAPVSTLNSPPIPVKEAFINPVAVTVMLARPMQV